MNEVEIYNLKKYYPLREKLLSSSKRFVKALDDVSLTIRKGETYGLVGESGCGKTTLGKCLIHIIKPTGGKIIFEGTDLEKLNRSEMLKVRQRMQIVFQDPYSSLNPRMAVGSLLREPLIAHHLMNGKEADERVIEVLGMVGLKPFHAHRYPHEFSGGQRQRISIARALVMNPNFIVCDEPVSALDVSVQSQVLNLLVDLRKKMDLTYLFISHDLSVVRHISDRIGVMYLGKLVESAQDAELHQNKLHPYTQALFSVMPVPKVGAKKKRIVLEGELPSPVNVPPGCAFHVRCPKAMPVCSEQVPQLLEVSAGHYCACHLY
ncbi:MAG: oligopeptide/dipeptide ABC transporter ATP-binding protein [Anaerolineaceae bacterium]|nr:oligopeptide/dipeptide ABC transporter ATP-binding protein [Anaerolineaceae bacterium]